MATEPLPLETANLMETGEFVGIFGDVAEHSPWVAEDAAARRPFASLDELIAAFQAAIGEAGVDRQRALLRAHPDLAGRAAVAGGLTEESSREQAGAGLDSLTPAEFERITSLNAAYSEKNGIPFILAVRGATKHDILAAFEARIGNSPEQELVTALEQVCRIVRFRLEDRVVG
ncbi:2-oxo-4-hydroxy-4-carboxy-5-ureidoimidazoline decarboxylase [Bauldia sp.]|uniref:2-oxo-4-hydroxy-4-carboxy-5-ureidoimidazoline decarboxylase n=1 Tax=Bauldia sp. TaxID=2575872 RepID=UPI0025B8D351|nr:2-oxo-4-hydroxy-4-carboxy-5-ureidoimidazoline decarboxylase [Bauldia sp.]